MTRVQIIRRKRRWIILSVFLAVIALLCIGFAVYVGSYYHAAEEAVQAMSVIMAAAYAAEHSGDLNGLILLAAYSTKNLGDSDLGVLSLYGSEDQVLNLEKYEEYKTNLPADAVEVIIDGGCHAGFGNYGPQKDDGVPVITYKEQIAQTSKEIAEVFLKTAG